MPLFAIAVAAYTAGLILGFAIMHVATALLAFGIAVWAARKRRSVLLAIAGLVVAGDATATARRMHDDACVASLAQRTTLRVHIESDAHSGAFVRGTTAERGCAVRVSLSVVSGDAPAGAVVRARGAALATDGAVLMKPASVTLLKAPPLLARVRSNATRAIERDFQDDAPLAKALLVADVSDLSPDLRNRFAMAGLVHILSISGLHVTIVASAMLLVLAALRVPKRRALIAGCALTAAYVLMIGAPPPAVRSAVMFGVMAASKLMQRPTSAWSSLAAGAAWPIATDARNALDIGWQLTVAGMIALIAAGHVNRHFVDARFSGWRRVLCAELSTGVIATIVTAPLVAWYFGRMSLVAPLANIAASPIANVLQPTLILALALAWWPAVSGLVADAARPGLRALDAVAAIAAHLPGANVSVAPTLIGAILAAVAIAAVIAAMRARNPFRPLAACLAAIALLLWLPLAPHGSGELELHAIDVGQGDALALRTPHGQWILIDAGGGWASGDAGRRVVVPYVQSRGGEVALFVLTHPHLDHVGGAATVLDALHPRAFWDGAYLSPIDAYRAALAVTDRRGIAWHRVHPGDSARIDGVLVRVLAPDSAWTMAQDDPNNASTVLMAEYGNTRMLLMGDAEAPEERWIEEHWGAGALHADVLKSGHHGSRTSSTPAFLDAVHARVAIVSVGAGNSYGLPSRSVMDAYAERGMVTLRTDIAGSIVVASDGVRMRVRDRGGAWSVPPR